MRSGSDSSEAVSTSPRGFTSVMATTVELTCDRPPRSEASLVPQHATEPAVALPISGVTSVCMPCGRRASRSRTIVTAAPTVTVMASRSTLMSRKCRSKTCVPVVAKHSFNEWKLPAALTGVGYRSWSRTTSISSSRSLGSAATLGVLNADPFQFLKVRAAIEWCLLSARSLVRAIGEVPRGSPFRLGFQEGPTKETQMTGSLRRSIIVALAGRGLPRGVRAGCARAGSGWRVAGRR